MPRKAPRDPPRAVHVRSVTSRMRQAPCYGFPLVNAVENACDGIEDEEEGKDGHTGHDDALRVISLRKQPDEREVLQEGSFGILPR